MGKILFSDDRCFGCGACINIAPENFTFSDDGRTVMINNEVNESAIEASEICPASAIVIENDSCNCSGDCSCGDNCNCTNDDKCNENCTCGDKCNCEDECSCRENCNCK